MTTILVTGGTGTLGRLVTERLRADGHEVRVLSRHSDPYAVDLREGGPALDRAVEGVDTVVHCATTQTGGDRKAAAHLLTAARRAGVTHFVYISIVGVDRIPFGYYKSKLAVERLIEDAGIPWTILRATQFHDLLVMLFEKLAKLPVLLVPSGVRDQPIEVAEVAARMAELATGPAAGRVPDLGGPETRSFEDFAREYLRATGRKRRVVGVRLFGGTYGAFRSGHHLSPEHAVGKGRFGEFLNKRFGKRL